MLNMVYETVPQDLELLGNALVGERPQNEEIERVKEDSVFLAGKSNENMMRKDKL